MCINVSYKNKISNLKSSFSNLKLVVEEKTLHGAEGTALAASVHYIGNIFCLDTDTDMFMVPIKVPVKAVFSGKMSRKTLNKLLIA